MQDKTLSKEALQIINSYLNLPFLEKTVPCPYFNNRRARVRGALKVMIGKGGVQDIIEEANIFAVKEGVDLNTLDEEQLRKFLVDHNLGIDCSGLVYYILDAELKSQKKKNLKDTLDFSNQKNPLRKLLTKFRTVENTSVQILTDKKNSHEVKLNEVLPGDFISLLGHGEKQDRNHIMLIHEVNYNQKSKIENLKYTHSFEWRADGKYNSGVRQGKIEVIDANKTLIHQNWIEKRKEGQENETFNHAKKAKILKIQRFIFF